MRTTLLASLTALALSPLASAAPIVFQGVTQAGAGDAAFNAVINDFRASLGGILNPPGACAPAPCTSGRREINWDAVPAGASSPNSFPGDFFNGTAGVQPAGRQRGATFTTPGIGFRVSATDFSDEATFDSAAEFAAFSPARLFASLGSPITDVRFSVPGAPGTSAFVQGFGVVFTDVDITGPTTLEFFDLGNVSLGIHTVPGVFPVGTVGQNAQESFSFLGVSFDAGERVGRVQITSGSRGIDGTFIGNDDAVVMDDFIYSEPLRARPVTVPATALLFGIGALGIALTRRRATAV